MNCSKVIETVMKIKDQISNVDEQPDGDINLALAFEQDDVLTDIYYQLTELEEELDPTGKLRETILAKNK